MAQGGTPVVFIHGLWLHASSWQPWVDRFQGAGYAPVAPGWPGDSDTVAETRSHAERLPGDILRVVESSGVTLASIDLFAIAAGPGTFTGLRIGIATIQGLAFVNGKRVVPVSALMALAAAASREEPAGRTIGAWMDAHRRDVFSALFETTDRSPFDPGGLIEIEGAAVGDPAATLTRWEAAGHVPDILVGDGAILFAATVPVQISTLEQLPLAAVIGRMAARRARAGERGADRPRPSPTTSRARSARSSA